MQEPRKRALQGGLAGAITILVLIVLMAVTVAYSGAYNVAASRGHSAGVRWLLDTSMRASVRRHADESPLARADAAAGAAGYQAMCEHCHGGPGVEPAAWSRGMSPKPPLLVETAGDWELAEIVWLIHHGVKSTGMPAFGATHDDAALWDMAAFVKELPAMTPAEYGQFDGHQHRH
jgi:mono/diheme cytochrome c family protein